MRVALATCSALPDGPEDETSLAPAFAAAGADAQWVAWDDPGADWAAWDAVLVRSPWDYVARREEFLVWARGVGEGRLFNPPEILAWNTDKSYLFDLGRMPTVGGSILRPGDAVPQVDGEWVVKPTVSAGALDTGRWSGPDASRHVAALLAAGRAVLVQPYLPRIEEEGETALVYVDGNLSHARRKAPILRLGETAPRRAGPGGLEAAEAMWDPGLMSPADATHDQRRVGERTLGELVRRFGRSPLYARVDLVPGDDGAPLVLEVELAEPSLWLDACPGAAERLAAALVERARRGS